MINKSAMTTIQPSEQIASGSRTSFVQRAKAAKVASQTMPLVKNEVDPGRGDAIPSVEMIEATKKKQQTKMIVAVVVVIVLSVASVWFFTRKKSA